MNRNLLLIFGWLIFVSAFLSGCGRETTCGRCLSTVFEGFNFVGECPSTVKGFDIRPGPVQSFPSIFERGKIYVFQSIGPTDTARVAIETFPDRLRRCSAKIIEAPQNPGDFAVASLGGPFWNIRFRMGDCIGHLTNKYDRKLDAARNGWPSGSRDDYILELSKAQ
jgi:hypothetical protein